MSKAYVNLSDVNTFLSKTVKVKETSEQLRASTSCISDAASSVRQEVSRLESCVREYEEKCEEGSRKISEFRLEIDRLQVERAQLTSELEELESRLAFLNTELSVTPPMVTITKITGYDADGNPQTTDFSEPNPEYEMLKLQISNTEAAIKRVKEELARVESQIDLLTQKVNKLIDLVARLKDCIGYLKSVITVFQDNARSLDVIRDQIVTIADGASNYSESARGQLCKVQDAIRKYMSEMI